MEALIIWIISGILHLIDCLKGEAPTWFSFWCVYAGLIIAHIGWIRGKHRRR